MLFNLLIIILILGFLGVLPVWPHSNQWGYYPSGAFALIVIVVLIIAISGRG